MIQQLFNRLKGKLRKPTSTEVATGVTVALLAWSFYQSAKYTIERRRALIKKDEARRDAALARRKAAAKAIEEEESAKKIADDIRETAKIQGEREEKLAAEEKASVDKRLAALQKAAIEKRNLAVLLEQEKQAKIASQKQLEANEASNPAFLESDLRSDLTSVGNLGAADSFRITRSLFLAASKLPSGESQQCEIKSRIAKIIVRRNCIRGYLQPFLINLVERYLHAPEVERHSRLVAVRDAFATRKRVLSRFQQLVKDALIASKEKGLKSNPFLALSPEAEEQALKQNAIETAKEKARLEKLHRARMEKLNGKSTGSIKPLVALPVKRGTDAQKPFLKGSPQPVAGNMQEPKGEATRSLKPFLKGDPQPVADNKVKSTAPFNPRIRSNVAYVLDVGVKDSFASAEQLRSAFPQYFASTAKNFLGLGGKARMPTEANYPRYLVVHNGELMPSSFAVRKVFDSASQIRGLPIDGKALSIQLLHPLWMAHPRVQSLRSYSPGSEIVNGRTFHWLPFPFVKEDSAWEFNLMVKAPEGHLGKFVTRKGVNYIPYVQTDKPIPSEFWVIPCKAFYAWNGGLLFLLADSFLQPKGLQVKSRLDLSMGASLNLAPSGLVPTRPAVATSSRTLLPVQESSGLDRRISSAKMKKTLLDRVSPKSKDNPVKLEEIMAQQAMKASLSKVKVDLPPLSQLIPDYPSSDEGHGNDCECIECEAKDKEGEYTEHLALLDSLVTRQDQLPLESEVPLIDWQSETVDSGFGSLGEPNLIPCGLNWDDEMDKYTGISNKGLNDLSSCASSEFDTRSENSGSYHGPSVNIRLGSVPPYREPLKKKVSTQKKKDRSFWNQVWDKRVTNLYSINPEQAIRNAHLLNGQREKSGLKKKSVPSLPLRKPRPEDYENPGLLDFTGPIAAQ
jgi:hypothetical protein